MKKSFFILLFSSFGLAVFAQATEEPILYDVEVRPTWKGCEDNTDSLNNICFENKLAKFFDDFIIYPERAKKKKLEGQVIVQFVVEKDGSISNIKIIRDIGEGCGDEVVRALQHLPKLVPGMNKGVAVRVIYKAPINFMLK